MPEAFSSRSIDNLRANKLRSFLTMFGILWGIIAVVVLTATGEGFQRGNQTVLEELGKNIAIVWGGRTTMQAGGERAGRAIFLTLDDARAIAASRRWPRWSARDQSRRLRSRAASTPRRSAVHGIEPQYQAIRTIDVERGRAFGVADDEAGAAGRDHRRRRLGPALRRPRRPRRGRADQRRARTPSSARSGRRSRTATTAVPTTTRCSCRLRRWPATSRGPTRRRARCRRSSSRPGRTSSAGSRACSTPAPAGSPTSTGRSNATCAGCWPRAIASIPRIATRSASGTPRSRR